MQNKEIRLASRPTGMPTSDNFRFVDAEVPQPNDGEVLVRTLYISVDPYLRGRMREGRSYIPPFEVDQVIESGAVGEVVESRSPKFQPGDIGLTVCQIAKIKGCRVVGIAGSDDKNQYLRDELGVDAAINYKTVLKPHAGTICRWGRWASAGASAPA